MLCDAVDDEVRRLVDQYVARLSLPTEHLAVTTDRAIFARWLGRRISASLGGAYVYLSAQNRHAILINLPRIDRTRSKSVEIVVAEELIHMRDRLDGDQRRHAKHGYDRIAHRVAALTGATLEEVRHCLLPVRRQPVRYLYVCPGCRRQIQRRRRGTWSCATCSPVYDARYRLQLVADLRAQSEPTS